MRYTINSKPIGDHQSLSIEFPKKQVPPDGWQFVAGADLDASTIEIEKIKPVDFDLQWASGEWYVMPNKTIKPWWKFW